MADGPKFHLSEALVESLGGLKLSERWVIVWPRRNGKTTLHQAMKERAMTHPGTPRDINLNDWLRGAGFHPADTELKQLGHEAVRQLFGLIGAQLHGILPPGQEKSVAFRHLTDGMMYANRALALGGGPRQEVQLDDLREHVAALRDTMDSYGTQVPEDPRIEEYKAEQRGDTARVSIVEGYDAGSNVRVTPGVQLVSIVAEQPGGSTHVYLDTREKGEEFASAVLTATNATFPPGE